METWRPQFPISMCDFLKDWNGVRGITKQRLNITLTANGYFLIPIYVSSKDLTSNYMKIVNDSLQVRS